MKTKEQIEQLGKQSAQKKYRLQHIPLEQIDEYGGEIKDYVTIFIQGYTQCQEDMADRKYTEEDLHTILRLRKEWYSHTDKNVVRDFIKSQNKED